MSKFHFTNNTDLFFGKGVVKEAGKLCKYYIEEGKDTVLLLTYASGRFPDIVQALEKDLQANGLKMIVCRSIVANPLLSKATEAIAIAKENNVGLVLSLGGGSATDSAKAVAVGYYYDGDIWDIYEGKAPIGKVLPVGAIPTIAGAGSEVSV